MIKTILVIATIFSILIFILFSTTNFKQLVVASQYNDTKNPIHIKENKYKDRYCNMTIKDIKYSAQAILENHTTLFFDDIGCLVLWLNSQEKQEEILLWVWAKDTNKYINAKKAWYSQTEKTPMNYGFGAYEKTIKDSKKDFISFDKMYNNVLNDKTLKNPLVKEKLLGNN